MSNLSWRELLMNTRQRPGIVLGHTSMNHLRNGIAAPLVLAFEKRAFYTCENIRFEFSPNQCKCVLRSGCLIDELSNLIDWDRPNVLLESIMAVQHKINASEEPWSAPFHGPINHFASCFANIVLAKEAKMAIRTREGLWMQSFNDGWPDGPPCFASGADEATGLAIYTFLEDSWFPQLPFTRGEVEKTIPDYLIPKVELIESPPNNSLLSERWLD